MASHQEYEVAISGDGYSEVLIDLTPEESDVLARLSDSFQQIALEAFDPYRPKLTITKTDNEENE